MAPTPCALLTRRTAADDEVDSLSLPSLLSLLRSPLLLHASDFLKHYAASARTVTEASHRVFNEFGIKLLDVQLIHFACVDQATQSLLDRDIITRVTKQNELLAREADVEIMKREKEVQMQQVTHQPSRQRSRALGSTSAHVMLTRWPAGPCLFLFFFLPFSQMDIEFEKSIKENTMELKRKELDVSRTKKENTQTTNSPRLLSFLLTRFFFLVSVLSFFPRFLVFSVFRFCVVGFPSYEGG